MDDRQPVGYLKRALAVGAFVALLAPPLGFWVFLVPVALHSAVTDGISFEALVTAPKVILLGALFSFVIGGVPALISAVVSGWIVSRNGTIRYGQALAIAVGASAAYLGAMAIGNGSRPELGVFVMVGGLSLVSAMICRWVMGRIGLLPAGVPEANKS